MKNLLIGIAITALVLVAFSRWSWTSEAGFRGASYRVRGGKPPTLPSGKTPRQNQEEMDLGSRRASYRTRDANNPKLPSGMTPRQHQQEMEGRPPRTPPTHWPGQQYDQHRAAQQKIVTEVEKLLAKGALHSINLRAHQVRIEPLLWATLVIEQKKNLVAMLSAYFDAKLGDGTVYVLSNRNDTKLADYWPGSKLGVRIHH